MWSHLSSDARFVLGRVLRYCAAVVLVALPVSQASTLMNAMVVRADFLGSWVQLKNDVKQNDRASFRVHVVNQGNLETGEAAASVIFPDGWKYAASHCPTGVVTTRERGYGNELVWYLPPLPPDQGLECDLDFQAAAASPKSANFMFAISGQNAPAVYREVAWQGSDSFGVQWFFELQSWWNRIGFWLGSAWSQVIHSVLRS